MNLKVQDIECQVIRSSNRKTVGIYVERDGQVVLRVPLDAPTDKLTKMVAKNLP
jgi:predicted metal-dependent hydrolase